jgi:4-hydroxybenzoate polyprenyltransferase
MFSTWLRLIRIHQWIKNLLVFVPLVTAHAYASTDSILLALYCFVAFCSVTSAGYVLNDILDINYDRAHPRKKLRPLAAGLVQIAPAIVLIIVLLGLALLVLWQVSIELLLIVSFYFLLSSVYSLWLKKVLLVDVFTLTILYTLRVIAGAIAIAVPLSFWLLAFSVFLFLSLAFLKRFVELDGNGLSKDPIAGRGYIAADREVVLNLGVASGYVSGLVFALFVNNQASFDIYSEPLLLWISCLVILFWINRLWMTAAHGNLGDDPVIFASRDPMSLVCALIIAASFWLAL